MNCGSAWTTVHDRPDCLIAITTLTVTQALRNFSKAEIAVWFPFVSPCFSTTLAATQRLLRSVWVNVMPERLLSVISGILAGGIPGFRIELCCFYHPLIWPLCVVLCFLWFACFSVAILIMTHKMALCTFVLGLCFGFLAGTATLDCVQVHCQHFLWLSTS